MWEPLGINGETFGIRGVALETHNCYFRMDSFALQHPHDQGHNQNLKIYTQYIHIYIDIQYEMYIFTHVPWYIHIYTISNAFALHQHAKTPQNSHCTWWGVLKNPGAIQLSTRCRRHQEESHVLVAESGGTTKTSKNHRKYDMKPGTWYCEHAEWFFFSKAGCQLMVNCWFGAWWFGFRKDPLMKGIDWDSWGPYPDPNPKPPGPKPTINHYLAVVSNIF